jgi:hypothetical protein
MRLCKECGIVKDEKSFTIACRRKDKVYFCSRCKDCDNKRRQRDYEKNRTREKICRKNYYILHREKWERNAQNQRTPEYKARKVERQRERRAEAYKIVRKAIGLGAIVRKESCEICNKETKTVAHHPDYDKPLFVLFVCEVCHRALHSQKTVPRPES